MNTPTPVIPDVIAGLTHTQVIAYFKELTAHAGVPIGFIAPTSASQKNFFFTYEWSGQELVSASASLPSEALALHIAKRPLTGLALAQHKLAEAQALLAQEQAKAGVAST